MLVVTAALQGAVAFASARVGRVALATAMVGLLGMGSMGPVQAQVGVSAGGSPSYSQAIAVPPGVAGMSPKIGLSYAGGGVNGPVGHGWSVQGISSITRCAATRAVDGQRAGVSYAAADKLCLDGQRLIQTDEGGNPAAVQNASGIPVASQVNDSAGLASGYREFRTEKDTYARIRAYGIASGSDTTTGPAYFKVWTKSGQIYEYGASPNASTNTNSLILPYQKTVPMAWAVSRISDTLGNYIDFKYEQRDVAWGSGPTAGSPTLGHEWNILEIQYSSNKVIFNYADRTSRSPQDAAEAYHQGSKNVSVRLLQSITTYINAPAVAGVLGAGSGVPVKTTTLSYDNGPITGRSRVTKIQECAGAPGSTRCLPATTFNYAAGGNDTYQLNVNFMISPLGALDMQNASGTSGMLLGDFNGDGKTDVLYWSDDPTQNKLFQSNGDGSVTQLTGFNVNGADQNLSKSDGCYNTIVADFNGDGRADLLRTMKATSPKTSASCGAVVNTLYVSNGDGTFTSNTLPASIVLDKVASVDSIVTCPSMTFCYWNRTEGRYFYVLDADGDGILDIVTTIRPAMFMYPSYGTGSTSVSWPADDTQCVTVVCTRVFKGSSSGAFPEVTPDTGTNLTRHSLYRDPSEDTGPVWYASVGTGDFNGDGLTDINSFNGLWLSTPDSAGHLNFTISSAWWPTCADALDANGDGRSDCLIALSGPPINTPNAAYNDLFITTGGPSGGDIAANFNLKGPAINLIGAGLGHRIVDINADGRGDILVWNDDPTKNVLYLSNGDGSFTSSSTFGFGFPPVQLQKSDGTASFAFGDFTGRGSTEILRLQTVNGVVINRLYVKTDPTPPDQLISVIDGNGATTTLYYVPLTNSTPSNGVSGSYGARYSSDRGTSNAATGSKIDLNVPMYVVATSETDSGIGSVGSSKIKTEMSYRGLKADLDGRGLLGFREVLRQSFGPDGHPPTPPTPLTVNTQYLSDHPYIGVAARTDTYKAALDATSGATPISSTVNIYCDQTNTAGAANAISSGAPCAVTSKVQRPYLLQSTETGKDLDGVTDLPTVVTQNSFNGMGDPLNVTVTTTGTTAGISQTFTKSTVNQYLTDNTACTDNQTCSWVLGRLSQATVTSTVPNSLELIATSAGTGAYATATAGTLPIQSVTITPSLAFGTVGVGSNSTLPATLTNAGSTALSITVSSIAVTGTDFSYVPTTTCTSSLAAGASCTINVKFAPSAAAARSGTLTVSTGAGTLTSTLSGTGQQLQLSFNPTTVAFGNQPVNGTYTSGTITLNNSSATSATGVAFSVPAGFSMSSNTCTATLANGASCSFAVTWSPTQVQTYSGTLTVSTTNGLTGNSVALSGTALSVSLSNVAFGTSQQGQSYNLTSTLTNNGTSALSVMAPTAASVTGSYFSFVSTTCGASLAAGANCTVTVNYSPTAQGTHSGSLSVVTGAGTLTSNLSGTAQAPMGTLSPVAFGTSQQGQSYNLNSTLINTGVGPLSINTLSASSVTGSYFSFVSTTCGASLAAGASCTVTVNYSPTLTGTHSGSLSVVTGAGTLSAGLSGTAQAPTATLSAPTWSNQAVGGTQNASATLTNTGVGPLSISGIGASAVSGSDFSFVSTTCPANLAASSTCTVTLAFTPSTYGTRTGNLSFTTGAGTMSMALSAVGTQASLSFNPSAVAFGTRPAGTYTSSAVTLTNNGNVSATGVSFSVPAGFSMSSNTCTATLASGASCSFAVTWTAVAGQSYGGSLTASTTSGVATNNVALSGMLQPGLSNVAFGTSQQGQSYNQTSTLTNTGGSALSVTAPTAASVTGSYFSFVSTNCGTSLAAGASCTVTVNYSPTLTGTHSGSLSIVTGAGTVSATLSGTAQLPSGTLSPVAFGTSQQGQSYNLNSTLTNTGVGPLSVNALSASSVTGSYFSFVSTTCPANLAAGASCTVTVNYYPTATGTHSGTLSAVTGAGTLSAGLSGSAQPPSGTLSNVAFGASMKGQSYNLNSTLTNTGVGPLSVNTLSASSVTGSYFSFVSTNCPANLAVNASCAVTVNYSPTAAGTHSGTLSVVTGAGTKIATLSGTATEPVVFDHVSPSASGTVIPAYSTTTLAVYYRNASSNPIALSSYGTSAGSVFTDPSGNYGSCAVGVNLAAGAKCWILVGWGGGPGTVSATVTATFGTTVINTAVSAVQQTLGMAVTGNNASTTNTADMTITLTNPTPGTFQFGSPKLNLGGQSGPGTWAVVTDGCGATLAANGGSCTMVVRYTAASSGAAAITASAYGTFAWNDLTDGNSVTGSTLFRGGPVNVQSTALAATAVALAPVVTVSPTSITSSVWDTGTSTTSATGTVTGGAAPFTYSWTVVPGSESAGTAYVSGAANGISANLALRPWQCEYASASFMLTVTDALGRTSSAVTDKYVQSNPWQYYCP